MKKIALLTLNGYFNYGNRLQNYALQEVLNLMGFKVETVINNNKPSKNKNYTLKERMNNIMNMTLRKMFIILKYKIWFKKNENEIEEREKNRRKTFKIFTLNYIKETNYTVSDKNIPENLSDRYDYFIAGSDQVWNPNYNFGSSIYFLTFTDKHKRIAYAPSFGVSEIKPEFIENYKDWIFGMHKLSVREDYGAKIIKELTGRDAPVLVDPTLLLTKEKWLAIAKEADNKPKGKYLLTYFLGGIPDNYRKQIKGIVKENRLEVINLGDIREKETYITGPSEFIDYINDCSVFCTDSFHGAVFSILLEKPFIVFERIGSESMYSRIETLLNKFNLNSREAENISWEEDVFKIDFSHVPEILEFERKKSLDYLKDALGIKDTN